MEDTNLKIKDYSLKKIIDKYEYGELLLTIKFSNIFLTKRIKREKLDDDVAYKNYIRDEINILSKISHKNIIKYETALKTKIHYYIIMEYCNGGTLRENLEKYKIKYGKPFSLKIVQHIVKQLVDVINYIYDNNIIIYDLSLDNINLNYYNEEAKVNLDIYHSDIKLTNYRNLFDFNHINCYYPTANINIIPPYFGFNDVLRSLCGLCYYLLTDDFLFYELNSENEYKISTNISLEAVYFFIDMVKYYFSESVRAIKSLLNHPFVEKYFGDFTDFNKNIVDNFIKDDYLILNSGNINEIKSIIFMKISQNN